MDPENKIFCRLCTTSSAVYHSLLQNDGREMLLSLTGIEISEADIYPTDSCVKCWLDLKYAYCIQQCFLEAAKKIDFSKNIVESSDDQQNIHSPNIEIKQEICWETGDEIVADSLIGDVFIKQEDMSEEEQCIDNIQLINDQRETELSSREELSFCRICGAKFIDQSEFYSHLNSHYVEPQSCSECTNVLPNIQSYRQHIQTEHPNLIKKTYTCSKCSLSFGYISLYNIHLSCVHPIQPKKKKKEVPKRNKKVFQNINNSVVNKTFQCEECNRKCESEQELNKHVKNHARKPCPVCGRNVTVYNLKKHIDSHEDNPVVCEKCGTVSKNREALRWHMYHNHVRKIVTCEECGQQFKKMYLYKLHIKKKHTGEKCFTCDTCGKGFFTTSSLNIHIRTAHLKERNYICKYCDKRFSKKLSLTTHLRIHTNELPYVCEICNEGFRQNVSLRTHRKSKHNIIEEMNTECPICKKMFRDDWALQTHTRSVHD